MNHQNSFLEKRSVTEKVLSMYVAGLLDPKLDGGNMIAVFDIVEHNSDGVSRLRRLVEEGCTVNLDLKQIEEATELLSDFRSING